MNPAAAHVLAAVGLVGAANGWARSCAGAPRLVAGNVYAITVATCLLVVPTFLTWRLRTALGGAAIIIGAGCLGCAGVGGDGGGFAHLAAALVGGAAMSLVVAAPLAIRGHRGGATAAATLTTLAMLGTLWGVARDADSVPAIALAANPLAHVYAGALGIDWIRGPMLYPRIGSLYFVYPPASEAYTIPSIVLFVASLTSVLAWFATRARTKRNAS